VLPLCANAGLINTSIGAYDVSTTTTSFNASSSLLTSQAWWGNEALAIEFAGLVGTSLGLPIADLIGPLFRVRVGTTTLFSAAWFAGHATRVATGCGAAPCTNIFDSNLPFAIATPVQPLQSRVRSFCSLRD
jgi:hypothetical protein